MVVGNKLLVLAAFVAILSGLASFTYFQNFVFLAEGRREPPLAGLWAVLLLSLLLSTPFLAIGAAIWPTKTMILLSSIHAAIFVSFLIIASITFRPGHSSLGDSLAPAMMSFFWAILIGEFVMLFVALARSSVAEAAAASLSPLVFFTAPLLVGWVVGVFAWSETLPSRVTKAAETVAGARPYCIEVDGEPVTSRRNLVAWSMLARNNGGYTAHFHALMAIGSGQKRTYANWSYRRGRFMPVSEEARAGLHLDRLVECVPTEHLLLKL